MTIFAQTLTNPGAEAGDTSGWTLTGEAIYASTAPDGISPHAGSYCFGMANGFSSAGTMYQEITVDAGLEAEIDADLAALRISAWYNNSGDAQKLIAGFYDGSSVLISNHETDLEFSDPANTWAKHELYVRIPANTRKVRITGYNNAGGFASRARWDEFEMDISDNVESDWPVQFALHATQLGLYLVSTFTSDSALAEQVGLKSVEASEGSSGLYTVSAQQFGAYVLCRPNGDRRELRAWTFKQDDHEFYGIQLGNGGTIVWDKLTNMWCTWKSPGFVYWRAEDVVDWEGFNLAGDTESGKIFKIDPTGRLDYNTTPITSRIVGYITHRFRQEVPCFMAELAVSEGQPPTGFDDGSVGITLRTSTDDGNIFVDHGEVTGEGIAEDITVRWYGLGLMEEPGMLFEITDTGYARRIDGLNIEIKE